MRRCLVLLPILMCSSLLAQDAVFAAWYDKKQAAHPVDDSRVTVDGLVAGRFEFSGGGSRPADSEIVRWAAPLRSDEPPGIRASAIFFSSSLQSPR